MIEVKSDNGNLSMACRGNLTDITADIFLIIHNIWEQLPKSAKDEFKETFMSEIHLAFMEGKELDEELNKKVKKILSMLKESDHEN